jgi:hypothetical protein
VRPASTHPRSVDRGELAADAIDGM